MRYNLLTYCVAFIVFDLLYSNALYAQILTNQNLTIYYQDPSSHLGQYVILTGKVSGTIPRADGYDGIQFHLSGNADNNLIVLYNSSIINNDSILNDCVRVVGTTGENMEYTNPSGAELSSPRIFAVMLDKIKCNDLVNPQIKPPEIEMTQVKDGINVTLQKVEFTPNEQKPSCR